LWLETRAKKVERANRRKQIRLAEEKAQILDKHQKLDAVAKQQKEFDKKRKVRIPFGRRAIWFYHRLNLPSPVADAAFLLLWSCSTWRRTRTLRS